MHLHIAQKLQSHKEGHPFFLDCEFSWKQVDNVSSIEEIYENGAKGKCGYEACWKGLKS